MNETESTQSTTEPRKRSYVDLYRMVFGLFVLICFVFIVHRFGISPRIFILGLIAYGVPFFILQIRSWNRWFYPERLPTRWSDGYARCELLQTVENWLGGIWILLLCIGFVVRYTNSGNGRDVILLIAYSGMIWDKFLTIYIEDRKYIAPPRDPYNPTKGGWAGTIKGIHSDHWGGRQIPKTKRPEA